MSHFKTQRKISQTHLRLNCVRWQAIWPKILGLIPHCQTLYVANQSVTLKASSYYSYVFWTLIQCLLFAGLEFISTCYGTVVPVAPSAVYGMYTCATLCPQSPIVFVCRQRAGGEEGLGRRQPGTSWLNAGDEKRYPCVNTKVSRPNRLSVSSLGRRNF